jgi:N-acetylmuramoyl-L-alanine amidase
MRKIKYIVLHCTATPQNTTPDSIKNYWKNILGWKNPGYHFMILADGTVVELLPIDLISNGVQGFNKESINISYVGGVDAENNPIDNRTKAQKEAMYKLVSRLQIRFPKAIIQGHRDFPGVKKACPSFDAKKWAAEMNLK